tara:strand:- start:571 stop:873 length:303 start_codon:yes stop_codon:yes gene_type:complete
MKQLRKYDYFSLERMQRLSKDHIYYCVWFDGNLIDGRKASEEVRIKYVPDKMFDLREFDECIKYIDELIADHCDYSFRIEDWDPKTESAEHFVFKHFEHP